MFEQMQWLDIIIMYKELADIIKQENGEGDGNGNSKYQEMMNDMKDDYSNKFNEMKSSMPKMPTNFNSMTAGLKMPKL